MLHLQNVLIISKNVAFSNETNMYQIVCWEKNRKTFFDFLSPGLGINVSLFRLRQFGEVVLGLGSPEAGVEIGTGRKRALFYTWKKNRALSDQYFSSYEFFNLFLFPYANGVLIKIRKTSKTSDIVNQSA